MLDEVASAWLECSVLDISIIGVGVEVFGGLPRDLIGRRMIVDVHAGGGASVSVHMVGQIRNTGPGPHGGTRVGMEFEGLSDTERSILDALEMMHVAW